MSLYKRGGVYWSYNWLDGVRFQQSTGTGNRRQAEAIDTKLREELNRSRFGMVNADPNVTFGELTARFVASASKKPHHLYHLKFLLPFFGDVPATRITKPMAEEFRAARRRHNPTIKDATVNRDLSVLRHILYWSVDELLIPVNPLARMKMARERRTRRQVMSVAEELQILGVATKHLRLMITLALDTGMRRGEITSQRWEDIDFAQGVLYVTHSKTPEGESREIPLSARSLALLFPLRQPSGLVVTYKDHAVRIVKRTWKTALKNAGVRHFRFHDLRHSFNTRLMEAGVLQEVRMTLMGHSAGSRVHATYTHIELPVKREAIRKLEEWKINQETQLKEKPDAHTETSAPAAEVGGTQAVEEEVAGRGGSRASRQTARRDRRSGGGVESETEAASEVRGGEEDLRGELDVA